MPTDQLQMKDQEVFLYLMTIAGEDADVHDRITSILSLRADERKPLLDLLLHHSRLQQAPPELKNIFTYLLDDLFAQEVLQYLKTHTP